MKQSQDSTVAIATECALLLGLLGCVSPVTATPDVCVLAPYLEPISTLSQKAPRALVPTSRPTLFLREPLTELRIEAGTPPTAPGRIALLWSWQWQVGEPLEGPQPWPLEPLQPGQTVTVRIRPLGATSDHFASIELEAAGAQRLQAGNQLLASLAGQPAAWRSTIDGLLEKGDRSLATALLFATEGPNVPDLNDLRRVVAQQSCR
jgi:hypothetical protein